jgi:AcrR family transcriptional regulator
LPKLKPDTQKARRENILDAAELCFARAGFRGTTMQDICREAHISPGALYIYFDSKEALIAGLCERNRAEFAERWAKVTSAPDFLAALGELAQLYFVEEPVHKRLMCVEIGVESTRNPRVCEIYGAVDSLLRDSFEASFRRLEAERRIAPDMDIGLVVETFMTIGDGLFWRRAVDPTFDVKRTLPAVMGVLASLLKPTAPGATPGASVQIPTQHGEAQR